MRRVVDVRGPRGKLPLDEEVRRRISRMVAAEGAQATVAKLRTSPTTLDKALHGLPMLGDTARRITDALDGVTHASGDRDRGPVP